MAKMALNDRACGDDDEEQKGQGDIPLSRRMVIQYRNQM